MKPPEIIDIVKVLRDCDIINPTSCNVLQKIRNNAMATKGGNHMLVSHGCVAYTLKLLYRYTQVSQVNINCQTL